MSGNNHTLKEGESMVYWDEHGILTYKQFSGGMWFMSNHPVFPDGYFGRYASPLPLLSDMEWTD